MEKSKHKPVLLKESIDYLKVESGIFIDLTLGGGGHSKEILKNLVNGKLICFDVDRDAIKRFENYMIEKNWKKKGSTLKKGNIEIILVIKNFEKVREVLKRLDIKEIDGAIADLGLSSDQIIDEKKGFSYMSDAELDMRMDERLNVKAKDLVNGLYESELVKLFKSQDEIYAKRIARGIINERKKNYINTTLHLVKIIQKSIPFVSRGYRKYSSKAKVGPYWKKPVQRVFQALRIAVNSELSSLRKMLPQVIEALASGKRMVVISFHSGEDRIVKKIFKEKERLGKGKVLNKKPIKPTEEEIKNNYKASSAKMRIFEKVL